MYIAHSAVKTLNIDEHEQPMDLSLPINETANQPSPRILTETETATTNLMSILNNTNPMIVTISRKKSPIRVVQDGYNYEVDEDQDEDTRSIDTSPPSPQEEVAAPRPTTETHTEPTGGPSHEARSPGAEHDLEVSSSDNESTTSTSSAETEELRVRKARFNAVFTVEDIGNTHTEIKLRTPKLYDCAQQ